MIPTGTKWQKWRIKEEAYFDTHGRGSGNHFVDESGKRWRLDTKGFDSLGNRRYAPKNVEIKNVENRRQEKPGGRQEIIQNTTLDTAAVGNVEKLKPPGKGVIRHHAAIIQTIGKLHAAFERGLNPSWKPENGPSKEGRTFLRTIQNKLGLYAGDHPLNQRFTDKAGHSKYHQLAKQQGIAPSQIKYKTLTGDQAYKEAIRISKAVQLIDRQMGFKSSFTNKGSASKAVRMGGGADLLSDDPRFSAINEITKPRKTEWTPPLPGLPSIPIF